MIDVLNKLFFKKSVAVIGNAPFRDLQRANKCDYTAQINREHLIKSDLFYCDEPRPFFNPTNYTLFCYDTRTEAAKLWSADIYEANLFVWPYRNERLEECRDETMRWHWELTEKIRTVPLTGMMAIAHLLSFPIQRLYVTGMNFYLTNDRVIPYQRDSHLLAPQFRYLKKLWETDPRVEVDEVLEDLFTREPAFEIPNTISIDKLRTRLNAVAR